MKDRFTVKIQSIAFGGSGVGRADGLVIFVPFTAPEDIVEIEIVARRKKFARGRLIRVVEPSRRRTLPLCRYYGICGGCSYQHIDYECQLEIKQQQVQEVFSRIGAIAHPEVSEIIPSPMNFGYRGKARLHAAKMTAGVRLGFMDVSGGRLVDIERCEIMDETINEQIREARAKGMNLVDDGDVTFWSGPQNPSEDTIVRMVKGREFLIPFAGFFQANLHLTGRMVDEVSRLIGTGKRDTIIDACCGSGLFSIFMAPYALRMIGVEINEKSVRYARENAKRQEIGNTEFICGDVEDVLVDMARRKDSMDLIILDPPRTGLSRKTIVAVSELKFREIIYISCDPATQARDVKKFHDNGYCLESLIPMDMFSQTEHIETIALLRRS
ncbi:MAG: class I SAM-dependent RNA methyltransferase [Smithellaceae bacterium]|nr:class I SAM-dependent RNA methyltransferase [Smithellaceae bacterium]